LFTASFECNLNGSRDLNLLVHTEYYLNLFLRETGRIWSPKIRDKYGKEVKLRRDF
jgi:hypothetical protein